MISRLPPELLDSAHDQVESAQGKDINYPVVKNLSRTHRRLHKKTASKANIEMGEGAMALQKSCEAHVAL
jgi:hypothetical protein